MASPKVFHSIRDITGGNLIPLEEADRNLVVLDVDTTNFEPTKLPPSKRPLASIAAEEQIKGKLKMDSSLARKLLDIGGWLGAGMRLPFANKENHELEKILEIKQRRFLSIQSELIDTADHLRMLTQNFTRASSDITLYNNLLISKRRQIEDEKSQFSLADRYFNRLKHEKKDVKKSLSHCKERCQKMEVLQETRLQNLAELRNLIEFDREALHDYHVRLENYQNQKLELRRIIEEDAKKVEELDKTYVELGAKRKVLNRQLDQENMQSTKCQEQLDRLSQEFRRFYKHRQQLIHMWSVCIETAKKKDAQMHEVAQDFYLVRQVSRELNDEIESNLTEYHHLICMNRKAKNQLKELDKKMGDARNNLKALRDETLQLKDIILDLQQDVRATAMEEKNLEFKMEKSEEECAEQEEKLLKVMESVEQLRQRLVEVNDLKKDSDMNINDLEKIYKEELKKADNILRDLEITRHFFWERSNERKILAGDIAHANTTMSRHRATLGNMEAKEFVNMEFLAKQSAKIYRLDLESSNLDKKIRENTNQGLNPQFVQLQGDITRLKEYQRKLEKERKFIAKEVNFLELMMTIGGSELAKNRQQRNILNGQIMQINMVSQRTEKLLDEAEKKIQDLKVEMSLESVNLKRLRDAMRLVHDKLFGLTEERKTINAAAKERRTEIEHIKALNVHKTKALMETVGKLKVQINDMEGRTHKLKGRFELVTKMMTGSRADDESTVAQKVKAAARERESLQIELRKWEKCVEEAKQELAGLENVVQLVHASNANVKEKLIPISDDSYESTQLELLDQEENALYVRKNKAMKFKEVLFDKLEDLQQKIAVMEQETQATFHMSKTKGVLVSRVENEILRQKEKVHRWNTLCCKMLREVKAMINKSEYFLFQKHIHLKMVQEKLDCAMTMVDRLITSHPKAKQYVLDYFENDAKLADIVYKLLKSTTGSINFGGRRTTVFQRVQYDLDDSMSSSSSPKTKKSGRPNVYTRLGRRSAVVHDHSQSQSVSTSQSQSQSMSDSRGGRSHHDDDTSISQSLSQSYDK